VLTPWASPIPPPNLLDKVARSISTSKGPLEWPHSVRATRVKLTELSRVKNQSTRRLTRGSFEDVMSIPEEKENESPRDEEMANASDQDSTIGKAAGRRKASALNGGANQQSRRKPLYRQNSMDFLGELPGVGSSLTR
jgi:hypothetical protein